MCSHYQAIKDRERFFRLFGVYPPEPEGKVDMWPGYTGVIVRQRDRSLAARASTPSHPGAASMADDAARVEALPAVFGLLPHWARDARLVRNTFNARSETVHQKPSFRDAWRRGQRCLVGVDAVFEPDWRSGKAVATRIVRADGEPMALAALWAHWRSPEGGSVHSFTLLTVNADTHPLMRHMHRPGEEKRMVVALPRAAHDDWLHASLQRAMGLLQPAAPDDLVVAN